MALDYTQLESDFDCACQDVIKNLSEQYKSSYQSGGPGMLEAFLDLIKTAFDDAAALFMANNNINGDKEAHNRITAIAKQYAKKCVVDYGKVE
jgi:hypothetical protein